MQAVLSSAARFAAGAALPLAVVAIASARGLAYWIFGASLVFLAAFGAMAAKSGGARMLAGAWRVMVWVAFAMAITAGVGASSARRLTEEALPCSSRSPPSD